MLEICVSLYERNKKDKTKKKILIIFHTNLAFKKKKRGKNRRIYCYKLLTFHNMSIVIKTKEMEKKQDKLSMTEKNGS